MLMVRACLEDLVREGTGRTVNVASTEALVAARMTTPYTVRQALHEALALAESICANAPLAVRESLEMANHDVLGDDRDAWERSHAAHARLLETEDVKEGIGAFFERRTPRWTGR